MLGLYFHWSFCLSKCIYCDFGSRVLKNNDDLQKLQDDYCKNCIKQLHYFAKKIRKIEPLTTIYFGGGTPSILEPKVVGILINEARSIFGLVENCEITLEANPTTFEIEKFANFAKAGINRLSLGVQSFNDKNLSWLGRKHTVEQAKQAIKEIKQLFSKWSFDLIYGLPKQTIDEWQFELEQALELEPKHLSLYTLIVDDNTLLGEMVKRRIVIPKTEDEIADFYEFTNDFIAKNSNLQHYEVSNYATDGNESKHNLKYWKSYDYIGLGAGAHGRVFYNDGNRYEIQNIFNPFDWSKNLEEDKNGLEIEKILTQEEQIEEILLMGLRIKDGIDFDDIKSRFGIDLMEFLNTDKIKKLQLDGLVNFDGNKFYLTKSGLSILDTILVDLF